ncbi:MAG TPA: SGNH/GDSL hydrolase family protein [Polyangiaceae bacterium]
MPEDARQSALSSSPPVPKGTTVLHIGDSFAGALGIALGKQLERSGVRSVLRYQTASFIPTWAWGKLVPKYLATFHPDLILVTLGANELEIVDPQGRAGAVRRLVAQFEGRPCVWIAPPLWERDTGVLQVIRDNCAPCRFMDTNELVHDMERVSDGVHPTMQAREQWAAVVFDWLTRERRPTQARPWAMPAE